MTPVDWILSFIGIAGLVAFVAIIGSFVPEPGLIVFICIAVAMAVYDFWVRPFVERARRRR